MSNFKFDFFFCYDDRERNESSFLDFAHRIHTRFRFRIRELRKFLYFFIHKREREREREMQTSNAAFLCKITMSVMRDPVMEPDGFSYEREAIEKWIRKHGTSPMTRRPLRIEDLKPNRALKDAIEEEYQKKKGGEKKKVGEDGTTPPPIPIPAPVSTNMNIRAGWSDNDTFALSFEPNDLTIPIPSDIVVVVDTSGSMQSEASVKNESGKKESNGLSVLDIVKHAARTIVHTMNEHDRFSLVEFNSEASVVCEPMYMTGTNCKAASIAIGSLRAGGRTNLWGGLEAALKTLLIPTPTPKRIQTVMLLTDGVPNIVRHFYPLSLHIYITTHTHTHTHTHPSGTTSRTCSHVEKVCKEVF